MSKDPEGNPSLPRSIEGMPNLFTVQLKESGKTIGVPSLD